MSATQRATILLAHGSTDANWLAPFQTLYSNIVSHTEGQRVELAYMELAEPSLQAMVEQLAAEGFGEIDILPLFFAAGRHLRKDVPLLLDEIQQRSELPLTLNLHSPVGLEPEIAEAISRLVIRRLS